MTGQPEPRPRFPHDGWFVDGSAWTWGRFLGTLGGLALAAPFIAATLLTRALGVTVTLAVFVPVALAALAGGIVLVVRRYRVLGLLLAGLAVGCGLAIWVTVAIGW